MNEGFIKLHRKFIDWEWYRDVNTKILFLHLLFKVNWKDGRFMGIEVPRGSLITSIEHLASETGLTVQNVRTSINKLKSTGELTSKPTNKYTLVTLTNYGFYQDDDKQLTNKSTDKLTNEQQTTNNNRRKKEYNNNIYAQNFEKFWEAYPKKRDKQGAFKAFKKIDVDIDVLLRAIEKQKQSKDWQKDDGQYIPYPSTWLNGHRWEDETDIKPVNTNQQPNLFAEMEEIIKRR